MGRIRTTRRDFLKAGATMAREAVFSSAPSAGQELPPSASKDDMIYRKLGRTGAQVSAVGVGGHHLGDFESLEEAIRLVHEAIDTGITFFDNCWEYYNGKTEN